MNVAEFGKLLEAALEAEQVEVAGRIVKNDLDELNTAKERGHWHGLGVAIRVLVECVRAITDPPKPPEAAAAPPQEEPIY